MSQKVTKSILPFVVMSHDRRGSFDQDLERAAIFCLAEQKREKGGGLLLKQPKEEMEYIAKGGYPFWWVGFEESGLLFDGLLTTSQTLTYPKFPDVESFLDNLEACETGEAYLRFLSEHLNYFQVLGVEEEKKIDGLIRDQVLLDEFSQYLTESQPKQFSFSEMVTISPKLDSESVADLVEEIEDFKSEFEEEIDHLYEAMKLVKAKTQEFLDAICKEMDTVKLEFKEEVEETEADISEKVKKIREDYEERMAGESERVEGALLDLQKAKIKIEKRLERNTEEIEHCETEIKACAVKQDGIGKDKWKERENQLKKEISEDKEKLEELNDKIKEIKEENEKRVFDLKTERDTRIKEADEDLMEIESDRDAQVEVCQEKVDRLQDLAPKIIEKIDELTKMREKALEEFGKLGIPEKPENQELVSMPFYLVSYKSDSEKRHIYFPPSIVKNVSFSVKIKGALGKPKINQLFQPRMEEIDTFLNSFLLLMGDNPVFTREVYENCCTVNLLQTEECRDSIESGLKKLKENDWLSEKEYENFHQALEPLTEEKT